MNNEPVAYVDKIWIERPDLARYIGIENMFMRSGKEIKNYIPLYAHPAKPLSNVVVASATCSCGKVMEVTNLQEEKTLTDEEIADFEWAIKNVLNFSQSEKVVGLDNVIRAILRKAQENG